MWKGQKKKFSARETVFNTADTRDDADKKG
jgi:hypothetical protein